MTIKLGNQNTMDNFENKKAAYMAVVKNEEATPEQHESAFNEMFSALQNDLSNKIVTEARNSMSDTQILTSRGNRVLTSEEYTFFNAVVVDGGFNDDSILPETVQEAVFEDLKREHPLLDALGLRDLGAVTRFIYSDPTKAYAWKELFGEISGQVNAAFRSETITQLKLTSYAVVPNDMLELGPVWIERYTRELLVESIATGLEYGYVKGRGQASLEPVGLLKNVDPDTGAVTDKTSSGTLTFAPSERGVVIAKELYGVVSALSTDASGKARKVAGKVVMVVNPIDAIAVSFRNTIQTANGQWVMALPYNIQVVESEEVPTGKAIFFVKGEYLAAIAGNYKLKKFDQTLAMEDATLYTIKRFANGRPTDNKAALVYDLNIDFNQAPVVETP